MLNGVDPIILVQVYKTLPSTSTEKSIIPLFSTDKNHATIAIVPLYLSEKATGLLIDTEEKAISIDTNTTTLTDASAMNITQVAISNTTTINMKAKANSTGLVILLALLDLLYEKVSANEYEITYLHGDIVLFGGLFHDFSMTQGENDDMVKIKLELSKGRKKPKSVEVKAKADAVRAGETASLPTPAASGTLPTMPKPIETQSVVTPLRGPT